MSIRRFKQDFLYDYAIPPYGFDYQTMTKKEAEEHFNWFLAEIPNRINYLESFCGNKVNLDFSYESLIDLWKFFLSVGRTEPIPKDELKELRTQFKAFGDDFVGTEQLSVSTEYLVRDIGIYLSEVYKKNSPEIYWHFTTKPKSYFFVNRPMLTGFVDNNYNPPYKCECDPIHMVGVQAVGLLDGSSDVYDLYNMAVAWKKMS